MYHWPGYANEWNDAKQCKSKLKPKYQYFTNQDEAQAFTDRMNQRARVHVWIMRPDMAGGFTVYNLRKDLGATLEDINPALYEPYEPFDGESIEIDLDTFQAHLNQIM